LLKVAFGARETEASDDVTATLKATNLSQFSDKASPVMAMI